MQRWLLREHRCGTIKLSRGHYCSHFYAVSLIAGIALEIAHSHTEVIRGVIFFLVGVVVLIPGGVCLFFFFFYHI